MSDVFNISKTDPTELFNRYNTFFAPLIPPGWSIYEIHDGVYPFGMIATYPDAPGLMVSFVGPETQQIERDSFTIWFMPHPFRGQSRNVFAKKAWRLGITPSHAVYQLQHSGILGCPDTVKTWPTWQQDLVQYLKLNTKNYINIVNP